MNSVFLEPLDVLFLRGNKLFGDPGSFGESMIPPWPSVAAGAIRSRMLVDGGIDPAAFARGEVEHPELGTPARPGPFTLTAFHLARRYCNGHVEVLYQIPADLVVSEDANGAPSVRTLTPNPLLRVEGLACSGPLPLLPVLAETKRSKPASGYWLTQKGWEKYLIGQTPQGDDLVKSDILWKLDHRVGVGLDAATHRAAEGRLFFVQAVSMVKQCNRIGMDSYDVGFLATVTGATPPQDGTLRLGGDGRAAAIRPIRPATAKLPEADFSSIAQAGRCRLVLATPGIFPGGWRLPGMDENGIFRFGNIRARVVSAAVPRFEVVSGWDLAKWQPKPAQRVAPTGSVYWLDELEATPEAIRKLAERGLWTDEDYDVNTRRAEGFNRISFAKWERKENRKCSKNTLPYSCMP
ncbi:MAG: type III-B CRISPR module-associated protein Cmr3 [Deltaproteobacteria bacterium]